LYLAHGVVCGMEYLHSIQPHPVIHGDLKVQNVLVGDGLVAKVCSESQWVNALRQQKKCWQKSLFQELWMS